MLNHIPREVKELPLGLIDEPTLPSRSSMDDKKLDELTADIRLKGLLQPMIVARAGERYEVIAGHRRRLACARAGLVVALCIIYPSKTDALDAIQFSENYNREELSATDEAIWFSDLLERKCDGDVDKLCELLQLKRGYVENRLLLFSGDPKVFEALQAEKIKIGVAHALNKCPDELQRRSFLHHAIIGGATQAIVEGWISQWQRETGQLAGAPAPVVVAENMNPIAETNYFTCIVCGGSEHVEVMRPYNVHQHCKLAILDPLLKSYRGENV